MTHSVRSHSTESIRNIAILGHAGAGKTTLIEALLAKAGEIRTAGSVEKGSTVCDFTEQEKRLQPLARRRTSAISHHDGRCVNLLDTPGYPDFMGRALAVLPAVETAAIVINAECGAELVAQRMMASAAERQLCRLVIVNKIDASGVDLQQVLQEIRARIRQAVPALEPPGAPRRGRRRLLLRARRARRRTSRRSRRRTTRSPIASSSSTTSSWTATSSRARKSRSSSCTSRSSGRCAAGISCPCASCPRKRARDCGSCCA